MVEPVHGRHDELEAAREQLAVVGQHDQEDRDAEDGVHDADRLARRGRRGEVAVTWRSEGSERSARSDGYGERYEW